LKAAAMRESIRTGGIPSGKTRPVHTERVYHSQDYDRLAVGFGEYTLYGASFIWRISSRPVCTIRKEGTIQTVTLSPVVAFKIIDGLSVGLGGRVEYLKTVFDNLNYVALLSSTKCKMTAKDWPRDGMLPSSIR